MSQETKSQNKGKWEQRRMEIAEREEEIERSRLQITRLEALNKEELKDSENGFSECDHLPVPNFPYRRRPNSFTARFGFPEVIAECRS